KAPHYFRLDNNSLNFVRLLIELVRENRTRIDTIIQERSENWEINRVALLDKNILRIAIAEIFFIDDIPEKVSINEAIELAKKYSTENSGKFVNGILDSIAFNKREKKHGEN
ncbi:MAG: transcription antitermination factor NusB, partial [Elusimicrobiota bacterium]